MGVFAIKASPSGYKFDLVADNGEIVASSEVYKTVASCIKGIEAVKICAEGAKTEDQTYEGYITYKNPKFELYRDKIAKYRFRLKAKNGKIIAVSQGYSSIYNAQKGIGLVKKLSQISKTEYR